MTNTEILNTYLDKVRRKSQEIKDETDLCYLKYKDAPDLEFLLRDEIQMEIQDFELEFNMSAPQALEGTIEARICFAETYDIYLDLVRYPREVLAEHLSKETLLHS